MLISDEFQDEVDCFVEKNCDLFEDEEENKMEYQELFLQYGKKVETIIDKSINENLPMCTAAELMALIPERKELIDEEIYDTLLAFTDFNEFKQMMLETKRGKTLQMDIKIEKLGKY